MSEKPMDEEPGQRPVPDEALAPARSLPGMELASRRQELGWTIEQVAARLNLAPRQVDALERDNYAALPGMATARGFVRAYAKLLRIDPAPLVAALAAEAGPHEAAIPLRRPLPAAPFTPVRLAPMNRGGTSRRTAALAVVALVVLAAVASWQLGWLAPMADNVATRLDRGTAATPAPANAATAASAPGQADAPAMPAGSSAAASATADGTTASSPNPAPAAPAVPAAPAPASPASPASPAPSSQAPIAPVAGAPANSPAAAASPQPVATTASPTPPATATSSRPVAVDSASSDEQHALVITAKEECWVELRRADNTAVLSRTLQPGTTERLPLMGPATLVVGNASGIEATLGGKPLDIRSRARNNIARLALK